MNGLCSKLNCLADFLVKEHIMVACITESHLVPSLSDSFIEIPGYSLIRHDTDGLVQKHGVCAYVDSSILVDSVTQPAPNVLTFRLVSFNVYVAVVYRPPSSNAVFNNLLSSFLSEFCLDKEVILVGDFNLPAINWTDVGMDVPPLESMFVDTFSSLGLTQWVAEATFPRSGNILDLVLTSEQDRIGSIEVLAPLPGFDHCPVIFDYVFQSVSCSDVVTDPSCAQRRAWHKGNYASVRQQLSAFNWGHEFGSKSAAECVLHMTFILNNLASRFVPLKKVRERSPPFQTRPPSSLIRLRHAAWQKYKMVRQQLGRSATGARAAYDAFSSVNRQYRSFAVRSQAEYESKLVTRSKQNPKLLHSYIRGKKVGRPSVGPLTCSGQLSGDPAVMAECLAESFVSVFNHVSPPNPVPDKHLTEQACDVYFTTDSVRMALQGLDGNSAMGPDNIHPFLLQSCASELAYPVSVIFQRSLQEGVVPDTWKLSTVIPLFKKGSRNDPLNYRPVSLTSVCCKTMERLITEHLTGFLERELLLNPNQFGFRAGRSTMDQLLLVYSEVSK